MKRHEIYKDGKLVEVLEIETTFEDIISEKIERLQSSDISMMRALDAWVTSGKDEKAWAKVVECAEYRHCLRDIEKTADSPEMIVFPERTIV
jgi:hypothetical protein